MITPQELMVLSDEDTESIAKLIEVVDQRIQESFNSAGKKRFKVPMSELAEAAGMEGGIPRKVIVEVVQQYKDAGWSARTKEGTFYVAVPSRRKPKDEK